MKILIINGPNLNMLGKRDASLYGTMTLPQINAKLEERARELDTEVVTFQSNSEGAIVDFIQGESGKADGIIINPGALTHYGYSLRDALADCGLPLIEVHLSNIYAREEWRHKSVVAPVAAGQICGLGWRGYVSALAIMVDMLKKTE